MRVGSVFTGIGGFDLAFQRVGCTISWQIEIERFCLKVLNERFPNVQKFKDVREVKGSELSPVELICGGFPCQDLSTAGRREGLRGKHSGLWWEFHRLLRELRPTWVVVENVPGMLSCRRGRDMGTILRSLGDLGYWWAYRVLDAQWFGLPQRRKRVFIVGHLGDRIAPAEVLFELESCAGNPPQSGTERQEASEAPAGVSGGFGESGSLFVIQDGGRAFSRKLQNGLGITARGPAYTLDAASRHAVVYSPQVADTLTAHYAKSPATAGRDSCVRNVVAVTRTKFPTLRGFGHGWQGQHWDDAIRSMLVRRLTPLECERLQGFPDGWTCLCEAQGNTATCKCPDSPRYRALGNAVAVPVVEWIAKRILYKHTNLPNVRM
jgi:DNA (cytosine-5)-methyltransferase 1